MGRTSDFSREKSVAPFADHRCDCCGCWDSRYVLLLAPDEDESDKPLPDGNVVRLWGAESNSINNAAGFDLERAVWDEVIEASCRDTMLEECERLLGWYEKVFGVEA